MGSDHFSLLATLVGAGLWGVSGTAAQALFERFSFPVLGLVAVRLLAGALVPFGVAPTADGWAGVAVPSALGNGNATPARPAGLPFP